MHWTMLLGVLLNLLCPVHTYRLTILKVLLDKACVIGQIQAGYMKKWMVEFVSGVDQDNVFLG